MVTCLLSILTHCKLFKSEDGKTRLIREALTDVVSQEKLPGMIAAITDDKGVIAIASAGVRKADTDVAITDEDLFHIGWPDAPHRVLRNSTVAKWEESGRPPIGQRPSEGEVIANSRSLGSILCYQSDTPAVDMEGNISAMPLYAGQSVGLVKERQPAEKIVTEIMDEAKDVLRILAR